jgi:hypothetical protein
VELLGASVGDLGAPFRQSRDLHRFSTRIDSPSELSCRLCRSHKSLCSELAQRVLNNWCPESPGRITFGLFVEEHRVNFGLREGLNLPTLRIAHWLVSLTITLAKSLSRPLLLDLNHPRARDKPKQEGSPFNASTRRAAAQRFRNAERPMPKSTSCLGNVATSIKWMLASGICVFPAESI